jgi:hypothetical protein
VVLVLPVKLALDLLGHFVEPGRLGFDKSTVEG